MANSIILFIFGIAFGSFFNVVAMRYDGDRFVFSSKALGGRSQCTHCKKTLQWFELIPLVSFLVQGGRCRTCRTKLSWSYPLMELITGCIFFIVPWRIAQVFMVTGIPFGVISALWIAVFCVLLLIASIDLRLGIIPDELTICAAVLGGAITVAMQYWMVVSVSFLMLTPIGLDANAGPWLSHIVGALAAGGVLGGLWLLTKGKGMGMGDVKLAAPLGLILGWPDIIGAFMASFIVGALAGIVTILAQRKTMESAIPFGPFLAVGVLVIFLWGTSIIGWYIRAVL